MSAKKCAMMEIRSALKQYGFVHLVNQNEDNLKRIIDNLGEVVQVTDVKVNLKSRALVTSDRELDFHTDHHKVKYILWYCYQQSSEGGITKVVNSEKIIQKMEGRDLLELSGIYLYEHKVFPDDAKQTPLLSFNDNGISVYYSFWLIDENDKKNPSLLKFQSMIKDAPVANINWKVNEILIIDNQKVLHGRTRILGNKNRFLKRFWFI